MPLTHRNGVLHQRTVLIGTAIEIEMPGVPNFLNDIEVEVAHDQLLIVGAAQFSDELPLRIAEVALAVKVVIAMFLDADAIDGADIISIEDGVRSLLNAPKMLAQSARGRRRDEDHLGAVQAEGARAFREMPVMADINTDLADSGIEDGITEIARAEIEFLPEGPADAGYAFCGTCPNNSHRHR